MSFFAYHFIEGVLVEAGGPKRKSLFSSEAVFDSNLVDSSVEQMIDYASALGACRSKLALQIISNMFKDRNWDTDDAPNISDFVNKMVEWKNEDILAPHKIINTVSFSDHFGKIVPVSVLHDRQMQSNLEQEFLFALLWGLTNPDKFRLWYEKDLAGKQSKIEEYKRMGLDVDFIPTLQQYLSSCDNVVKDYEKKMGGLSATIPSKLIADAQKLGVSIE